MKARAARRAGHHLGGDLLVEVQARAVGTEEAGAARGVREGDLDGEVDAAWALAQGRFKNVRSRAHAGPIASMPAAGHADDLAFDALQEALGEDVP